MLTATQVPYTGPLARNTTKLPCEGKTVLALKHTLKRMGFLGDDAVMDEVWRGALDAAFRAWQKSLEMPSNGVYGEQMWKALRSATLPGGKYALAIPDRELIRDDRAEQLAEAEALKCEKIRAAITEFCLAAEANEDAWHYSQVRPVTVNVNPRASFIRSDCSAYVIQAFAYAKRNTGYPVPDPAKQRWTGYGNSDYYEDDHMPASSPYRVGDLAHYGETHSSHVAICRRGGTSLTAVFSSHGSEAGPIPVSLNYRHDLLKVVRPPLL